MRPLVERVGDGRVDRSLVCEARLSGDESRGGQHVSQFAGQEGCLVPQRFGPLSLELLGDGERLLTPA